MRLFRSIRVRLILAVAFAGAAPPARPARADDPSVELWRRTKLNWISEVRALRPLNEHQIRRILQMDVKKRMLDLSCDLSDVRGEGPMQVTFDSIPGFGKIDVHRTLLSGKIDQFSVNLMDFPEEGRASTLSVYRASWPAKVEISRTVIDRSKSRQVLLVQQAGLQSAGEAKVILQINEYSFADRHARQVDWKAADFSSLVMSCPEQVDRNLRPILRALGREEVLAPSPEVARQVLGDSRKPDPAVVSRVQELLPGLNAPDYRVRDATLYKLNALGPDAAIVLRNMNRTTLTPEQNARIDRFLLPYVQLSAPEAAKLSMDPGFLLDCLYLDDTSLRDIALGRLRSMFRPDLQFDPDASADDRVAAVSKLRQQILPAPSND